MEILKKLFVKRKVEKPVEEVDEVGDIVSADRVEIKVEQVKEEGDIEITCYVDGKYRVDDRAGLTKAQAIGIVREKLDTEL